MNNETKELCAEWWAHKLEIEDKREQFKQALLGKIHENMWLEVDYDPDPTLLEALRESGIECRGALFSAKGIFPPKMIMRIRDHGGKITVKDGYGQPFVELTDRRVTPGRLPRLP